MSRQLDRYAHNLYGSLIAGYARRTREHLRAAESQVAGWLRPYSPSEASSEQRYSFLIELLLEEALLSGVSEQHIADELRKQLSPRSVEERALRTSRRVVDLPAVREDPSRGVTWEEFDAFVQSCEVNELRRMLRAEASLRRAAQEEAEALRSKEA